jgi:hypothetical protein
MGSDSIRLCIVGRCGPAGLNRNPDALGPKGPSWLRGQRVYVTGLRSVPDRSHAWFLSRAPIRATVPAIFSAPRTPKLKLPHSEYVVIPVEKVRDYLLAAANPRSRGKAGFFQALGFDPANWEALRDALLELARTGEATLGQQSEFGTKYEIRGTINGPAGRRAVIRTAWIVNAGEDQPRFITGYPD